MLQRLGKPKHLSAHGFCRQSLKHGRDRRSKIRKKINVVTSGEIVRRKARRGPSANLPLLGPLTLDAEQPGMRDKRKNEIKMKIKKNGHGKGNIRHESKRGMTICPAFNIESRGLAHPECGVFEKAHRKRCGCHFFRRSLTPA